MIPSIVVWLIFGAFLAPLVALVCGLNDRTAATVEVRDE